MELQFPKTSLNREPELTQELLNNTLTEYINKCHSGRVRKGCAAWYTKLQELGKIYKGYKLDQAMFEWTKGQIESSRTQLRIVH